jgi:hypothetical protein
MQSRVQPVPPEPRAADHAFRRGRDSRPSLPIRGFAGTGKAPLVLDQEAAVDLTLGAQTRRSLLV